MVLDGIDTYDLAKLVKKYMREGWQPLGGVVCSDSGRLYLQAMVQYEEENSGSICKMVPTSTTPFDLDLGQP